MCYCWVPLQGAIAGCHCSAVVGEEEGAIGAVRCHCSVEDKLTWQTIWVQRRRHLGEATLGQHLKRKRRKV